MAIVPVAAVYGSLVELEDIGSSVESLARLVEFQKELFHSQIDQLQKIVVTQCKLTGANPLAQEMAAGALSVKIGKRPRDLLNPKAVKYMQTIFSIKDTIGKKETREISAFCGITATQVRNYFSSQRSNVRKLVRLSHEKATKCDESKTAVDECSISPLQSVPPDISNRAKVLLARWSNMFFESHSQKNSRNSLKNGQKEMIRNKQRTNEVLGDKSWQSKLGTPEEILALAETAEDIREPEP